MPFERKNNTGALFLNKRKTEEKHPDYTGQALIGGKPMSVSAWVKTDKKGNKYISFCIQEPYKKPAKPQQVSVNDFESTQETYDEGLGEPQQDFNQQVDEFVKGQKTDEDYDEPLPF